MMVITVLVLCSWPAVANGNPIQVTLEADRPSLRVQVNHTASLHCCYSTTGGSVDHTWITRIHTLNSTSSTTVLPMRVNTADVRATVGVYKTPGGALCHNLTLRLVRLNDAGLYQCFLNHTNMKPSMYTHGTYLQVYKPHMKTTLDISETAKNKILVAEGVLLLLCVLLPGVSMLFKSNRRKKLEKRKAEKEEENIYEGLNLEDCSTTYDQIQHSRVQATYQDVGYRVEEEEEEEEMEEEEIQLEKP